MLDQSVPLTNSISVQFVRRAMAMAFAQPGPAQLSHIIAGRMDRSENMKRVVFICVENSNRSQMAEAFLRMYAAGQVEVYSAGSRPSGQVHPKAIAAMLEIGYDLGQHRSKALSDIPDIEYDAVVTMGCGDECPRLRAKQRENWDIPCPKEMPHEQFRKVRDLISEHVKALVSQMCS